MRKVNPKKLKYDKIVSVKEAVRTAPTLFCVVLRRSLLEHNSPSKTISPSLKRSVQHIVNKVSKDLTTRQLGSDMDETSTVQRCQCVFRAYAQAQ